MHDPCNLLIRKSISGGQAQGVVEYIIIRYSRLVQRIRAVLIQFVVRHKQVVGKKRLHVHWFPGGT